MPLLPQWSQVEPMVRLRRLTTTDDSGSLPTPEPMTKACAALSEAGLAELEQVMEDLGHIEGENVLDTLSEWMNLGAGPAPQAVEQPNSIACTATILERIEAAQKDFAATKSLVTSAEQHLEGTIASLMFAGYTNPWLSDKTDAAERCRLDDFK